MKSQIYEQAATWEHDLYGSLRASRKRAWVFAGASWGVSAILGLSLLVLIPLKETVPYVVQQDPETSALKVLRAVDTGSLTQQQALVDYHLVEYVLAREGYDRASIQNSIDTAFLLSAGTAKEEYLASLADGAEENPVAKYGDRATVTPEVKSVSMLNENTASVRFSTTTREQGRATKNHWVAIMAFRFVRSPASPEVRWKNPLGFQVTSYRRSSEVVRNDS